MRERVVPIEKNYSQSNYGEITNGTIERTKSLGDNKKR